MRKNILPAILLLVLSIAAILAVLSIHQNKPVKEILIPPAKSAPVSGTTLSATKTLDICVRTDGLWQYSGEILVWNSGAVNTQGFKIFDHLQTKVGSNPWVDQFSQTIGVGEVIPAGTNELTATSFPYNFVGEPLTGDIRNVADVTITNHSGKLGIPFGPSPKATYTGSIPPSPCKDSCEGTDPKSCTYTRGYWGSKPGIVWPAPYDRNAIFYYSGLTWQNVLTSPAGGNAYYILGPQFIAAKLNVANGAALPDGVKDVLTQAEAWFNTSTNVPSTCSKGGTCGTQKAWAQTLDDYNNGIYPGGPPHCADESK